MIMIKCAKKVDLKNIATYIYKDFHVLVYNRYVLNKPAMS